VSVSSYNATGGQYGGYMNITKNPATSGGFGGGPILLAANPLLPNGNAWGGEPFGVEYVARVRVNTFNWTASDLLEFGVLTQFDAPGSLGMQLWTGKFTVVSNASLPLGQWGTIKAYGIVMPPIVPSAVGTLGPLAVASATGLYMRPGIRFNQAGVTTPSQIVNMDIDYFQTTNIGLRNEVVQSVSLQLSPGASQHLELFEFLSMFGLVLGTSASSGGRIIFPSSASYKWADWRQTMLGRKFSITKTAARPFYILPSSGMTLKLDGRTAAGTITLVESLTSRLEIEKTDNNEFTVHVFGGNGAAI